MPIANYMTLIRIFIGPLFLLAYLYPSDLGLTAVTLPFALAILLGCSELSDAFDGYLARKFNQVTDLGKILDPMADSIYRISIFLTFTIEPVKLPMGLVFIFLYRDSVISTLRTICALRGFALAARKSGKIKAVIQALAAFAVLVFMLLEALHYITNEQLTSYSTYTIAAAGIYTLFTGIEYLIANRAYIKKILSPLPSPEQ
jgi:CDP-diacylglycerol--glycerol-3-phosphate 3-phosphatidyltransferase